MGARRIIALALLLSALVVDRAWACDRPWPARRGLPRRGVDRVVGIVTGYIPLPPGSGPFDGATALRVRGDEIVSGSMSPGERPVVVASTGRDCRGRPATRQELERLYPIGTAIAVRGSSRATTVAGSLIVADDAKGGLVQAIPPHVVRTAAGDLDFVRFDMTQPGASAFVEFEFDRAVLTLGKSRPHERIVRVENLALYPGFADTPAARFMYRNLVVASGASPAERDRLLREFEDRMGKR